MELFWLFITFQVLCISNYAMVAVGLGQDCTFAPPCKCSKNGFTLDLEGIKRPLSTTDDKNYNYYIDPCGDTSLVPTCQPLDPDLTACQVSGPLIYGLGSKNGYTAVGNPSDGTVIFKYEYDSAGVTRKTELAVVCSSEQKFVYESEDKLTYKFTLFTPAACMSSPDNGGISPGTILTILFFVFLIIYLVGGVLFLKIVRKAEGREAIPNFEFWKELPGLIAEGFKFTFRGCKTESTYEKI